MSLTIPIELKEVGCDYITAVSTTPSFKTGLGLFGTYLVRDAISRGHKRRDSRTQGYQTMHAGSFSVGARYDGCIVRASGKGAQEHWNQICDEASNVTRFDLQITGVGPRGPSDIMANIWKRNPGWTSGRGRRSKVKERSGPTGIESMEVCSRQSELFCRIYDKALESMLPEYANCIRFELELKGDLAYQYSQALTIKPNPDLEMFRTIQSFARSKLRSLVTCSELSEVAGTEIEYLRAPAPVQDCYRTLAWLKSQVSPAVKRLVSAGHRNLVLEALGLTLDEQSGE